jgi:hypothetical protein
LWHFDNVPLPALKVILYLTDTRENGATTRIMDFGTSQLVKEGGYFGLGSGDRVSDLGVLGARMGRRLVFSAPDMEAGDALIFHTNCFHQAALPVSGYRDALTFFILPARKPWRANLQNGESVSIERRPGGFPPDPAMLDRWN